MPQAGAAKAMSANNVSHGINLGLLINFNVLRLKDGIKRMVVGTDWR